MAFIAVGENIHCTRIYKVGGRYVRELDDGSQVIAYRSGGQTVQLPIPASFHKSSDWEQGKVRHTAVAIWQGMYGDAAGQGAGREYVQWTAARQAARGATFLDINVDEFSTDVEERIRAIRWAVEVVQEVSDLPLSIDSSNVNILEAGLAACSKSDSKPMVNSVSLERPEAIDVAGAAEAVVIAGASGETSMPSTKDDRVANVRQLMDVLTQAGFALSDIYLDPLVCPVSVDSQNGGIILDTIRELRDQYGPEIHFAPGLSNVSFGMPHRKLLNQVFAHLCVQQGLDGGIVDPLQINAEILDALDVSAPAYALARAFLVGEDDFGMSFIAASREGGL